MAQDNKQAPLSGVDLDNALYNALRPPQATSAPDQNRSALGDIGSSIVTGALRLPGAVTGLADIAAAGATFGLADRPFSRGASALGRATGLEFEKMANERRGILTPETQAALQEVEQAEGFFGTLGAYAQNPRAALVDISESLPATLAGGFAGAAAKGVATSALARGSTSALARGVSKPVVAAGIGEGSVAAGMAMENIDENVNPLKAALASTAIGAGVGVIAGVGARIAQKAGFADPELVIVNGRTSLAPGEEPMGFMKRVIGGGISEGVFQELPQGSFEQIVTNYAEDKPLFDGVDKAAVSGLIAGFGMGAGANIVGPRRYQEPDASGEPSPDEPIDVVDREKPKTAMQQVKDLSDNELLDKYSSLQEIATHVVNDQGLSAAVGNHMSAIQNVLRQRGIPISLADEASAVARHTKLTKDMERIIAQAQDVPSNTAQALQKRSAQIAKIQEEIAQIESRYPDAPAATEQAIFNEAYEATVKKGVKTAKREVGQATVDAIRQQNPEIEYTGTLDESKKLKAKKDKVDATPAADPLFDEIKNNPSTSASVIASVFGRAGGVKPSYQQLADALRSRTPETFVADGENLKLGDNPSEAAQGRWAVYQAVAQERAAELQGIELPQAEAPAETPADPTTVEPRERALSELANQFREEIAGDEYTYHSNANKTGANNQIVGSKGVTKQVREYYDQVSLMTPSQRLEAEADQRLPRWKQAVVSKFREEQAGFQTQEEVREVDQNVTLLQRLATEGTLSESMLGKYVTKTGALSARGRKYIEEREAKSDEDVLAALSSNRTRPVSRAIFEDIAARRGLLGSEETQELVEPTEQVVDEIDTQVPEVVETAAPVEPEVTEQPVAEEAPAPATPNRSVVDRLSGAIANDEAMPTKVFGWIVEDGTLNQEARTYAEGLLSDDIDTFIKKGQIKGKKKQDQINKYLHNWVATNIRSDEIEAVEAAKELEVEVSNAEKGALTDEVQVSNRVREYLERFNYYKYGEGFSDAPLNSLLQEVLSERGTDRTRAAVLAGLETGRRELRELVRRKYNLTTPEQIVARMGTWFEELDNAREAGAEGNYFDKLILDAETELGKYAPDPDDPRGVDPKRANIAPNHKYWRNEMEMLMAQREYYQKVGFVRGRATTFKAEGSKEPSSRPPPMANIMGYGVANDYQAQFFGGQTDVNFEEFIKSASETASDADFTSVLNEYGIPLNAEGEPRGLTWADVGKLNQRFEARQGLGFTVNEAREVLLLEMALAGHQAVIADSKGALDAYQELKREAAELSAHPNRDTKRGQWKKRHWNEATKASEADTGDIGWQRLASDPYAFTEWWVQHDAVMEGERTTDLQLLEEAKREVGLPTTQKDANKQRRQAEALQKESDALELQLQRIDDAHAAVTNWIEFTDKQTYKEARDALKGVMGYDDAVELLNRLENSPLAASILGRELQGIKLDTTMRSRKREAEILGVKINEAAKGKADAKLKQKTLLQIRDSIAATLMSENEQREKLNDINTALEVSQGAETAIRERLVELKDRADERIAAGIDPRDEESRAPDEGSGAGGEAVPPARVLGAEQGEEIKNKLFASNEPEEPPLRLTAEEWAKIKPVNRNVPFRVLLNKAKKFGKKYELQVIQEYGQWYHWVKGVNNGFVTVAKDGSTYSVEQIDGEWHAFEPLSEDGVPQGLDERVQGPFKSEKDAKDWVERSTTTRTTPAIPIPPKGTNVRYDTVSQDDIRTPAYPVFDPRRPEQAPPPPAWITDLGNPDMVRQLVQSAKNIKEGGSSAQQVYDQIKDYQGASRGNVRVVQSVPDLLAVLRDKGRTRRDGTPITLRATVAGYYIAPKSRANKGTIFLVADNIPPGKAKGVLLHELSHRVLTKKQVAELANKIRGWAANDVGQATPIAQIATRRMEKSLEHIRESGRTVEQRHIDHELVAYFAQVAYEADGEFKLNITKPENIADQKVAGFFREVLNTIHSMLRKVGMWPGSITGEEVVMAILHADNPFREPINDAEDMASIFDQSENVNQLLSNYRNKVDSEGRVRFDAVRKHVRKVLKYGLAFGHDLRRRGRSFFRQNDIGETVVDKHHESVQRRGHERRRMEDKILRVMQPITRWPLAKRQQLSNFLVNSTLSGAWGFTPDWDGAVNPTNVDPVLAAEYDAMDPEQQKAARDMYATYDEIYTLTQEAYRGNIEAAYDDQINRASPQRANDLIRKMEADLAEFDANAAARTAGYMPLKRNGKYATVFLSNTLAELQQDPVNNASEIRELKQQREHYYVAFHERTTDADRDAQRVRAENESLGYEGKTQHFERMKQRSQAELISYNQMEAWRAAVETVEGFDEMGDEIALKAAGVRNAIDKLYIAQLEEGSIRKSELSRLKVDGFNRDMLAAFDETTKSMAGMISALNTNRDAQFWLQQMRNEASEFTDGRDERMEVLNEVLDRHALQLEYQPTPIQNNVMGFTSLWMLLSSPGYYMQNLMQVTMLTWPTLMARYGMSKASTAVADSYKTVYKGWASAHKGLNWRNIGEGELFDYEQIKNPNHQRLFDTLRERNLLDVGMAADLGSIRDIGSKERRFRTLAGIHRRLVHAVRSVEVINRGVAGMAAFDLEYAKSGDYDTAEKAAIDVVEATQGDYSNENAPSLFRKLPFGKVITQFRKFQLIQLSLLARMIHGSFSDADVTEKAIARRQLGYVLGVHGVIGGFMAMPGMGGMIGWLMAHSFGDEDEPKDIEMMMRRRIGDKDIADLLLGGLPHYFGVPATLKLGMGQALSIMPFTDIEMSRDGATMAVGSVLGGPATAQAGMILQGLGMIGEGNLELGVAQMMPKGVKDVMKAVIYKRDGVRRLNASRDIVLTPEEISWFDFFGQGLGWPTAKITDRSNLQRYLTDTRTALADTSATIKADYIRAWKERDARAMQQARKDWRAFQQRRVDLGFNRQSMDLLTKAPREQRKREQDVVGGVPVRRTERGFVEQYL